MTSDSKAVCMIGGLVVFLLVAFRGMIYVANLEQRPHDRRACEDIAYRQQAERQSFEDHNWINARVYMDRHASSERILQADIAACAELYK